MLHIAVFGSGKGSNFGAILEALKVGKITGATIRLVLSNNSRAGILDIARVNDIPAVHVSERQFSDYGEFARGLLRILAEHGVNFIVLAGYMKKVPGEIVAAFRGRILNIHPALLPKFGGEGMYGMRVHEAVIAAGEKESGATVHRVEEEYDRGPIVAQRRVPVYPGDTPESLAARVLRIEHELYPEAIGMIASGTLPTE